MGPSGRRQGVAAELPGLRPSRQEIAPGAVHLSGWLRPADQQRIVSEFQAWAGGPVPLRAATLPGGSQMSVETVCLGWHWRPYRYTREAEDVNGAQVLGLPDWLARLARHAVVDAYLDPHAADQYVPDAALVNFYGDNASMGMHQDRDERAADPVVSLSVGNACRFRFGNTQNRGRPYTDIDLAGGDAFVFGGPSRLAYHGVPKVHQGTGDFAGGLLRGRINVTMRVTGM